MGSNSSARLVQIVVQTERFPRSLFACDCQMSDEVVSRPNTIVPGIAKSTGFE
jgi:hypothetical protein